MTLQKNRFNRKHDQNIRETVAAGTGVSVAKRAPRARTLRWLAAAAAICLCLFGATSALAMGVPAANGLLYLILPEAAQFFKPVQKSAVDQEIEVKVESAYIHGTEAEAVISVRDLTDDRLDESIDLYDSYDIQTGFDSVGTCSQIGYDPETKTATFLIWMKSMRDSDIIQGEKITLTVQTLLSGKTETLGVPVDLDWSAIPKTVETELADPYDAVVMAPGDTISVPHEGFYLTGIGYVGGELHIQLYTPGRDAYDDHAFLYLQNENEERIYGQMLYRGSYNCGDAKKERRADYVEYAFDVPQSELENYLLFGDFYSASLRIDGNWSVTFPLDDE